MSATRRACDSCTRRKVKCDKCNPCSNCSKTQRQCMYGNPIPSQRHRKRIADDDLLSKINEYEALLRKHSIEFHPLDTSWIPSQLEQKLPQTEAGDHEPTINTARHRAMDPAIQDTESELYDNQHNWPPHSWFGLPKELRLPPVEKIMWPGSSLTTGSMEARAIAPSVVPHLLEVPMLRDLHPQPRHIIKLWQLFMERVDPVSKVVHCPTLQHRIHDVAWNLESIAKPLEAIMFSTYALAAMSASDSDCINTFGECRSTLLVRYRSGAAQALAAADLHHTRDLEVLQALVLFILFEPRSEVGVTLISLATRIGHKMGLHRPNNLLSFFEQEMHLRVWWQIRFLEYRARRMLGIPSNRQDFGDIRLPLNVNDAELHPRMADRPAVDHDGPTEMLYYLIKLETTRWAFSSGTLRDKFVVTPLELVRSTGPEAMRLKKKAYEELRGLIEEKSLRHCDQSIPLHHLAATTGQLILHAMRFWCSHPQHQPDEGRHMSSSELDNVFESSIRILELELELNDTQFPMHLIEHMSTKTLIKALVYMVSELRQRTVGPRVMSAWSIVEKLYQKHPELLQDSDQFHTGLMDLILDAWTSHGLELHMQGVDTIPEFIKLMQTARGERPKEQTSMSGESRPQDISQEWATNDMVDWWNEFLDF